MLHNNLNFISSLNGTRTRKSISTRQILSLLRFPNFAIKPYLWTSQGLNLGPSDYAQYKCINQINIYSVDYAFAISFIKDLGR